MVRPKCRVVVRPEPRVNLRNDDLQIGGPNFVDLLAQQGSGVKRVRANLDFLRRISRNQLIRIDRLLEGRRITVMPSNRNATGTM